MDECELEDVGQTCAGTCINTIGSFRCSEEDASSSVESDEDEEEPTSTTTTSTTTQATTTAATTTTTPSPPEEEEEEEEDEDDEIENRIDQEERPEGSAKVLCRLSFSQTLFFLLSFI